MGEIVEITKVKLKKEKEKKNEYDYLNKIECRIDDLV